MCVIWIAAGALEFGNVENPCALARNRSPQRMWPTGMHLPPLCFLFVSFYFVRFLLLLVFTDDMTEYTSLKTLQNETSINFSTILASNSIETLMN